VSTKTNGFTDSNIYSAIDGSFILEFSAVVTAIFSFDVINTEIRLSNLRMNLYKRGVGQNFV
jgi:hypothetical protein